MVASCKPCLSMMLLKSMTEFLAWVSRFHMIFHLMLISSTTSTSKMSIKQRVQHFSLGERTDDMKSSHWSVVCFLIFI